MPQIGGFTQMHAIRADITTLAKDAIAIAFCCFGDADLEVYQNALARVAA